MAAHRRPVSGFPFDDGAGGHAAVGITGDAVIVSFRKVPGIHELALLHGREIAAVFNDFLEKHHGAFLEFPDLFGQMSLFFQIDHLHQAVQSHECLARRVHPQDIVVMPGNVPALVRRDRALDVGGGHAGNQGVQDVGDGGLGHVGFHVPGVLLCPEFIALEQIAQGDGIGQIEPQLWGRRCRGRHRGKGNIFPGHAGRVGKRAVNGMLHQEFGHDLPGFLGRGIGIVGAVDLENPGISHDGLGLGSIHEGPVHVDVPVQHVVLGVLVGAVDAFLRKHHRDFRPGHAAT